jgi:hypothetical protein
MLGEIRVMIDLIVQLVRPLGGQSHHFPGLPAAEDFGFEGLFRRTQLQFVQGTKYPRVIALLTRGFCRVAGEDDSAIRSARNL